MDDYKSNALLCMGVKWFNIIGLELLGYNHVSMKIIYRVFVQLVATSLWQGSQYNLTVVQGAEIDY